MLLDDLVLGDVFFFFFIKALSAFIVVYEPGENLPHKFVMLFHEFLLLHLGTILV